MLVSILKGFIIAIPFGCLTVVATDLRRSFFYEEKGRWFKLALTIAFTLIGWVVFTFIFHMQ